MASSYILCGPYRATFTCRAGLQNSPRIAQHIRSVSYGSRSARPLKHHVDSYFEDLLTHRPVQPATRTSPAPPPATDPPKTAREETLQKARVVFGSRLAGPADRRRTLDEQSTIIAGVRVPPRPDEPDNCCMSGCVNCVWDRYRDELEEWAAKRGEAERKMWETKGGEAPGHVVSSMDDDGGGSETNWTMPPPGGGADLFSDIPVGIREFMRTEKKLKERKRRKREGVAG